MSNCQALNLYLCKENFLARMHPAYAESEHGHGSWIVRAVRRWRRRQMGEAVTTDGLMKELDIRERLDRSIE